jgi:hypothetical protein
MTNRNATDLGGEFERPVLQYGRPARGRRAGSRPPVFSRGTSEPIDRSSTSSREGARPTDLPCSGALIVGQAVLQQYQQLMQAQRRRESLRESIVGLLERGANVEAGVLTAYLRRTEQRRFSAELLERLLGTRQVEILRSQLEPIVAVQLIIEPCSGGFR